MRPLSLKIFSYALTSLVTSGLFSLFVSAKNNEMPECPTCPIIPECPTPPLPQPSITEYSVGEFRLDSWPEGQPLVWSLDQYNKVQVYFTNTSNTPLPVWGELWVRGENILAKVAETKTPTYNTQTFQPGEHRNIHFEFVGLPSVKVKDLIVVVMEAQTERVVDVIEFKNLIRLDTARLSISMRGWGGYEQVRAYFGNGEIDVIINSGYTKTITFNPSYGGWIECTSLRGTPSLFMRFNPYSFVAGTHKSVLVNMYNPTPPQNWELTWGDATD